MSKIIILSLYIFNCGILGMCIHNTHLVNLLINLELLILGVNFNFILTSILLDEISGQVYALLFLSVAAAESAIGLAPLIGYYRLRGGISVDLISLLKG